VRDTLRNYEPTNDGGKPTLRSEQNHRGGPAHADCQQYGNHSDAAVHRRVRECGEPDGRHGQHPGAHDTHRTLL
jgi:hypothetical protein